MVMIAAESIMRFKDKIAIVTGSGHGTGEAKSRLFVAEGAKVVVSNILASEAERVGSRHPRSRRRGDRP
jgi:NAD(P)-dependent dehydrogenase (short-subunit alcohol dehydrogenase family)